MSSRAGAAHAVVLRADLRGLMKTAEQLSPQSVLPMLDEYVDLVSQVAREQVSNRWRERADARVALSIGIHYGEVVAASLGSGSNRGPTLVGDTVNVAARLAQRARAGEAILSASIREALRDQVPDVLIKPLGGLSFAARTQRVDIYCIPRLERLELGEPRPGSPRH